MGFGYLISGYLMISVLYLTANGLGFRFLAILLGACLLFAGLRTLSRYHSAFSLAKYLSIGYFVLSLSDAAAKANELFSFAIPFFETNWQNVYAWAEFFLTVFFVSALLFGISRLASSVGLLHLSAKAIRNSVFLLLYAILYLIACLPFGISEGVLRYFVLPTLLSKVIVVVLNLTLLISCMKNICPAGEDEPAPKRYRWEFLNKIGDTFEKNRQESIDSTKTYFEEKLRDRKEQREKKRIQHRKK